LADLRHGDDVFAASASHPRRLAHSKHILRALAARSCTHCRLAARGFTIGAEPANNEALAGNNAPFAN
jgi:hypothetical protein